MKLPFGILFFFLMFASPTWAATLNVAACTGSSDQAKVQTQVNAAVDGDVVQIQAGNCTFTGSVTWSNKNITVQGAGVGVTNITSNSSSAFSLTPNAKAGWRITAMTISSSSSEPMIWIDSFLASSVVPGRFRIDHCTLNMTGGQSPRGISIQGLIYGLIDHCTINATTAASIPTGVELNAQSTADAGNLYGHVSWNLPLDLGGDTAVYVEDCVLTQPYGGYGVVNNITYGGRMVIRHSKISGPQHAQTHSTRGNDRGGMKSEYYNNVFDGLNDSGYPGTANIISGTGVVFNNTMKNNNGGGNFRGSALVLYFQRCPTGDCIVDGAPLRLCAAGSAYDGGIEANGWPCLDQPGRTGGKYKAQASVPVYVWNNGPEDGCSTGGSCSGSMGVSLNCSTMENYIKTTAHSNGDKDYCVGTTTMPASCGNHTNTYTPYTYPHPLQLASQTGGGDVIPPATPQNFRVLP